LITPYHCALRVGGETRSWTQGQCFIFDDTVEHEAWNRSDSDRVVLMIDFTKPGTCYSLPESFAFRLGDILKASQRYRPGPR
jgi:aspartyl/asparaginyl beta-hydroxylase (cupin superfamily)